MDPARELEGERVGGTAAKLLQLTADPGDGVRLALRSSQAASCGESQLTASTRVTRATIGARWPRWPRPDQYEATRGRNAVARPT